MKYLNREAAKIVGLTPRQVLDWSEKEIIKASNEDESRARRKRLYGFLSLVELRLAKILFEVGFGPRAVKNVLSKSRGTLLMPHMDGLLHIKLGKACSLVIEIAEIIKIIENRIKDFNES
jgi:DNA-binding transcriptional MerR regulator